MKTRETRTGGVWRSLAFCGLMNLWLSGCGGGGDDFGPTKKFGLPTGKGDAEATSAVISTAPNKSASPESDAEKPASDVAGSKEMPTTAPTSTQPEGSDEKAEKSDKVDAKAAVAAAAQEKLTPKSSREDDESPMQVAKTAATPAASGKAEPAGKESSDGNQSAKPAGLATEATPELTRQPLSSDVREWLMVKRRQASAFDGLSVLTAANLSKVSWHDLRNGQLSREFFGRSGQTTGLGIGPKRNWIIGATEVGWVRLWTIDSQAGWDRFARDAQREAQVAIGGLDTEQNGVWVLAVSPKGEWFVTGGEDGSLRKCSVEAVISSSTDDAPVSQDAPQRAVKLENKVEAHVGAVTALKISADGAWAVSGGTDQRVRLWETKTWTVARTWTDMPTQIIDVSLSSDGRIVAATGLDKFVRWWSAEEPEMPPEPPKKETKSDSSLANANKPATKETKPKNGLEHPDWVLAVAVSSDGNYVATGCKDRMVRVWDLATGQPVEKHDGSKEPAVEVRFLDHDERLFFADRAGNVRSKPRVRRSNNDDDAPSPTERTYQFATPATALNPAGAVISVAVDVTESSEIAALQTTLRIASSRETRGTARNELLKVLNSGTDDGQAEKMAALEKQLVNATSDSAKADLKRQISRLKTVAVSQEKSERPKLIGTLTDIFPAAALTSASNLPMSAGVQLAIPGEGELLTARSTPVVGNRDDEHRGRTQKQPAQLWAWDIATQTLLRHWDDVPASLEALAWLDSTNQLVSLSGHAFGLPSGQSRSFGHAAFDPLGAIAVTPDGRRLAVGFIGAAKVTSKVLRLLDADSLQEMKTLEAFESLVTAVAFAPDGASVAVAVRERQIHRLLILDAETLAVLATVEEAPHSAPWLQGGLGESRDRGLTTLLFSSDGRFLLTHGSYASNDYRLTLWQKKGNKWSKETGVNLKASQPIIDDSRSPTPAWFLGGKGGQLAAITSKGLGIVDTSNGRLLRSLELRDSGKDRGPIAWSADGTWLAQGDDAGYVTLWNLRVEKEAAIFPAQLGPVKALALSHDGRVLATLGEENKLHLWNLDGWQPKNRVAAKSKATKPAASSD